MSIPAYNDIIEPNDQTEARQEHLEKLRELVGNVYPNKFVRSDITAPDGGTISTIHADTITNILHFAPVVAIIAKIKAVIATLAERERPPAEIKDALNARLREFGNVQISGRLTTPPRGNFVHLTDGVNKLQIYAKKATFALIKNDGAGTRDEENGWTAFGLLDHGDFVGVDGYLFITNTGELSVHVEALHFLAKAMVPMPDKMHGIADPELQRRHRYADLIASTLQVEHEGLTTREVFERRAKLITGMRRFLDDAGFIEVETPMLTPKATGAAAKPFETHHNALDIPLYARIAPELYLKRLVVGGFEKVYELNRNFRNEGLSQKHNPEFTMLEFYAAYMDVNGMMDFAEKMIQEAVKKANGGSLVVKYGENGKVNEIDFGTFERISMKNSIAKYYPSEWLAGADFKLTEESINDIQMLRRLAIYNEIEVHEFNKVGVGGLSEEQIAEEERRAQLEISNNRDKYWEMTKCFADGLPTASQLEQLEFRETFYIRYFSDLLEYPDHALSKERLIQKLFEMYVERRLTQPTFIVDYPKSISPLSKASPDDPNIAERFELFINGMEVANGFSELNDPLEQYERFADQMNEREGGDEEAMVLDEDYIKALAYGMPPAAGIGIGIDRLVMLLTNKHSIRDVILFPHMRPERKDAEKEAAEG